MKFIQLIEQLARHVGTHQIPLNPAATQRQGLIESSALHYELITQIVGAIYTRNRCRRSQRCFSEWTFKHQFF